MSAPPQPDQSPTPASPPPGQPTSEQPSQDPASAGLPSPAPPHPPARPQPSASEGLIIQGLTGTMIAGDRLRPYRRGLLWGAGILIVLFLFGLIPRLRHRRELAAESRTDAQAPVTVTVAKVERAPSNVTLTLPGNIEAAQETQLNARTGGYIRRYYVDIGDRVRPNQLLADIDTPEVDQEAQQAGAELARAQATLAQSQAQAAQQTASLQTSRANAARANADVARAQQNTGSQRGQLREARANADLARVTWQRWQSLVEGGAISQQEADEKHAAYNASLARVAALEAALRAANADVEAYRAAFTAAQADIAAAVQNVSAYRAAVGAARAGVSAALSNVQRYNVLSGFRQIRAPYAGVITARSVDEGALVSSSGTTAATTSATGSGSVTGGAGGAGSSGVGLFTLARIDTLRLYIQVPQTEASDIQDGQMARVQVRELPHRNFSGRIVRTANALDPASRTLRAEVMLPNPASVLLPGMYGQVIIDVPRRNPPLLIPAGALVTDARGNRVATVQDNRLNFQNVEIGRDFGQSLEITSGLNLHDTIVTNPTGDLRQGARVHAITAPPPSEQGSGGGQSQNGSQNRSGSQQGGQQNGSGQGSSQGNGEGQNPRSGGQGNASANSSPNQDAQQQESHQGGESTEARSQPGGVARAAAQAQQSSQAQGQNPGQGR